MVNKQLIDCSCGACGRLLLDQIKIEMPPAVISLNNILAEIQNPAELFAPPEFVAPSKFDIRP
jgi:hypothetical protein